MIYPNEKALKDQVSLKARASSESVPKHFHGSTQVPSASIGYVVYCFQSQRCARAHPDFYFGSIKGAKSANWYFFDINKL
jgi:hypothetical protein